MRTLEPSKTRNADADIAKEMIEDLITTHWRSLFIGTRRIKRFAQVAKFPNTSYKGMDLQFSYNHIEATYADETYVIDFDINKTTGQPEKFLFSSNWNARPYLLKEVNKTFLQHLSGLIAVGAA